MGEKGGGEKVQKVGQIGCLKGCQKGGGDNQHTFCLSQQDPHSRTSQLNDGVDTGAEVAGSKTRRGGTFHSNKNNKEL